MSLVEPPVKDKISGKCALAPEDVLRRISEHFSILTDVYSGKTNVGDRQKVIAGKMREISEDLSALSDIISEDHGTSLGLRKASEEFFRIWEYQSQKRDRKL